MAELGKSVSVDGPGFSSRGLGAGPMSFRYIRKLHNAASRVACFLLAESDKFPSDADAPMAGRGTRHVLWPLIYLAGRAWPGSGSPDPAFG